MLREKRERGNWDVNERVKSHTYKFSHTDINSLKHNTHTFIIHYIIYLIWFYVYLDRKFKSK